MLYGIVYALDPASTGYAMDRSLALAERLLPVLGIVLLVLFFSNLLLQRAWVHENLGVDSGLRSWLLAVVGGILAAGPVYPWYALLGELRSKGMRTGLMSVFLYSRAIKLPLVPLLIHYFGLAYTLTLFGYLILLSLPAGVLLERLVGARASGSQAREA
jgi:uncharacterized membrane protein YraQ (UPF0718 family)